MRNPWNFIALDDYENHMKLDSVYQIQMMSKIMKDQFYTYSVDEMMILGIAGGNGLEHVDKNKFRKIYGVDVNKNYLEECMHRFTELGQIFVPVCADFADCECLIPSAELVIANLFIEYIGVDCFADRIKQIGPVYLSSVIQADEGELFVSDSPYMKAFDGLESIHHQIDRDELINAMGKQGYINIFEGTEDLPNNKRLIRLDFKAVSDN